MMKKLCLLLCLIGLLIPSVTAQDDIDNLLELLNAVPDLLEVRESFITFVDYRNVEQARKGAPFLKKFADLNNLPDPFGAIYMAAFRGISSGPDFQQYLFAVGEEWEETVGFDFMDIDRALAFGTPPTNFDVLIGDFDLDAIAEAHTVRNYTSQPFGDMTIWCGGEVGCDGGTEVDIANRNLANPFGGDLGREKPFIISDTTIVSMSIEQGLILVEDAIADKLDSLADNPAYLASLTPINRDNIIIQGAFIHPSEVILDTASLVIDGDADAIEALMIESERLPFYQLVTILDTATDEEQVVYVVLVYRDPDSAQIATEVVPERLNTMESLAIQRPIMELLAERGIDDIIAEVVIDEDNNRALAVFEFRAPLADNVEGDFGLVPSSMIYRLFIDMVYQRDLAWIATSAS